MRTQTFLTKVDQPVTMRVAGPGDRPAIERLAALDSQRAPHGDVIVAEVGGEVRAAVAVDSGTAIADPFRRTADLVELLRERVSQVAPRGDARREHGFGLGLARAA
jgi:hypothetical protein